MNKSEFIDKVAERADLTRAAAAKAVDAIFDTASGAISEAVHGAGALAIPGFGKFTKKTRAARTGRNPRTGAQIEIPERSTVSFSAGKGLKSGTSTSRRKAAAAGAGAALGAAVGAVAGAAATKTAKRATKSAPAKSGGGATSKSAGGAAKGAKKRGGGANGKSN
ncbi:MAG TPA: HU family DNA-binding protein [Longimicrobium sp.]|nr:HU family DNA-binding protein [Longimicrobium sp.]